ncbi:MAG TPA: prolyl oligopeptidase family serine peptidase [Chitinophagales bacterium]|nr:prolyl oligopeptidase family serine peptidase [Chitinophagales bacterium]
MKKILLLLLCTVFLFQCKDDDDDDDGNNNTSTTIPYGKNRYTKEIDGVQREFYVHIPQSYDSTVAVPVVFMLHGTSGDGEKFYNISGWKEVGETENIITVFPSSGSYCIIEPDGQKTTTKWNTPPDAEWIFCPNETPLDDIKFLKEVVTFLPTKFNIDTRRIYLVGFSNGGQMAAKCAIEMSDIFAAIVESAGSFYLDTTYTPQRKLPITYQVGNDDWGPGNEGPDLPLSQFDSLLNSFEDFKYYRIKQRHINHFDLNPNYTITGDTASAVFAHFVSNNNEPNNLFQFVMVKGLKHAYPNGTNHPAKAAVQNWAWFKQFTLP